MTPRNAVTTVVKTVAVQAKSLASPTVPNYKTTAAAAGAFALSYLWSSFEGCSSSYLNAGLAVTAAALALSQFGFDNSYKAAASAAHCVSNAAVSKYHSLFAKHDVPTAKAEIKDLVSVSKDVAATESLSPSMKKR
jgi:hypothetical protein